MSKEYTVVKKFVHRCDGADKMFNVGDTPPEDEGKLYSSYLIPSGFIAEKGTKKVIPPKTEAIKTEDPKDAPVPQPVEINSELDLVKAVENGNPKTEEPKTEEPKTEEPKTEEPKTEEPPAPAKKKASSKKTPAKKKPKKLSRVNKEG